MKKAKKQYVDARDRVSISVGDAIKMSCELNEISQAELSRLSGVSPSNLSDIIHGRRLVGKVVAEKIAGALNVSPSFILFGGTTARKGAEVQEIKLKTDMRDNLLFNALKKLRVAEKRRGKIRTEIRSAIVLITKALKPDPMDELEFLIASSLLAGRSRLQRAKTRHHR